MAKIASVIHHCFLFLRLVLVLCLLTNDVHSQDTTRLSLLFLGDVMQHDSQIAAAYDPVPGRYDYNPCFEHIRPALQSADLAIGNLEVTLAGPPYNGFPQFSAPDALAEALKASGVDILVTANNHCVDRGQQGLERTIAVLDTLRILHTGTFLDPARREIVYPLLIERNGFRLSLLNYTYGTNGLPVTPPNVVNRIDTIQLDKDIAKAHLQETDVIIVFFHWGSEYQSQPNREQKLLTEFCFRRGVKLVIGAHPHVLQPMVWRRETDQLVAYSLGNFVSGQRVRYRNGGTMLHVDLEKFVTDSSSNVFIRNPRYELQYVYRDAGKKYFVLPVQQFEGDTVVVKERVEREQLRQFATDSRALMGEYNWNVGEQEGYSTDSVFFVSISPPAGVIADSLMNNALLKFYNVQKDSTAGLVQYLLGAFHDKEIAMKVLLGVRAIIPHLEAVIVGRKRY